MTTILNIDSSGAGASVSIGRNGLLVDERRNRDQKTHAGFIQPAISELLEANGVSFQQVDAICVTAGPGSYTGLRVGMATAKGLCYALDRPLITIGTLDVMAFAAVEESAGDLEANILFCPMIDARRMEVFTALYNSELDTLLAPAAMMLEPGTFQKKLLNNKVYFFGSGAEKWQQICRDPNASFGGTPAIALALNHLAARKFAKQEFSDLAYSEPLYLKEFFTPGGPTGGA